MLDRVAEQTKSAPLLTQTRPKRKLVSRQSAREVSTPLEDDTINFEAMPDIVLKKKESISKAKKKSAGSIPHEDIPAVPPSRMKVRRPSLCRHNEVSDWVDTREGREAARKLEEDMIRELARLSTRVSNLDPETTNKQQELLIQGMMEHGIDDSDSESLVSDLDSHSDISFYSAASPRSPRSPLSPADTVGSPNFGGSPSFGSPPLVNLGLS